MINRFQAIINPLALIVNNEPQFTGYVYDWKLRQSSSLFYKKAYGHFDMELFMRDFKQEMLKNFSQESYEHS